MSFNQTRLYEIIKFVLFPKYVFSLIRISGALSLRFFTLPQWRAMGEGEGPVVPASKWGGGFRSFIFKSNKVVMSCFKLSLQHISLSHDISRYWALYLSLGHTIKELASGTTIPLHVTDGKGSKYILKWNSNI